MKIRVMYATLVDIRFFLGKLPASLMEAIDRDKLSLYEKLKGNPLQSIGKFADTEFELEGQFFTVIFTLGKPDSDEDGQDIQDLWVLRIETRIGKRTR